MKPTTAMKLEDAAGSRLANAMGSARHAQRYWAQLPVPERLQVIRRFRGLLAGRLQQFVSAVSVSRPVPEAEILVSEIMPLLDAAKFLERMAVKTLLPRKMGSRLRPVFLGPVDLEIRREPFGLVLVIGPGNYALFLAGVQVLQALVAGNAVLLKPGRSATAALRVFQASLVQAGIDASLVTLLSEEEDEVSLCVAMGVDKIVLTGSSHTGKALLALAAPTLTPITAELSGSDAVFVLAGADVGLAARAIVFGLTLNQSRTCMRPHRIFVHESLRAAFTYELRTRMANINVEIDPATARRATRLVAEAVRDGARVVNQTAKLAGLPDAVRLPLLMENVPGCAEISSADIFAPILVLEGITQIGHALESYDRSEYALGVSVFGPAATVREVAQKVNAGFVVINDVIAPTADPRLPFSGRARSGCGTTRGAEGLLELTQVKAISTRASGFARRGHKHLEPTLPGDGAIFAAFIQTVHGSTWKLRWQGIKSLTHAVRHSSRTSLSLK